jgi:hypothetical protein
MKLCIIVIPSLCPQNSYKKTEMSFQEQAMNILLHCLIIDISQLCKKLIPMCPFLHFNRSGSPIEFASVECDLNVTRIIAHSLKSSTVHHLSSCTILERTESRVIHISIQVFDHA